ncbi:hypothetical protein KCU91_g18, partial [Aureobasidium melanogenum]
MLHTSSDIAQVRPGRNSGKVITHLFEEARVYNILPVHASQFGYPTMVDRENVRKFLQIMKRDNPKYQNITIDYGYINT